MKQFVQTAIDGKLASGRKSNAGTISKARMGACFTKDTLPKPGLKVTPTSRSIRNPSKAMFEAIGSYANRRTMFLVSRSLNGRKGKMFEGVKPMSDVILEDGMTDAIKTGKNEKVILQPIREVSIMYLTFSALKVD